MGSFRPTTGTWRLYQDHNFTGSTVETAHRSLHLSCRSELRKKYEKLVECTSISKMPTKYGEFTAHVYVNKLNEEHHVALVKGSLGDGKNVLTRVHSECLTGDVFGSLRCDCGQQFARAMELIDEEGRGIVLYNEAGRKRHRACE